MIETKSLKLRFEELKNKRSVIEGRWEKYAGYTLPYMFPTDDYINDIEMQGDYQTVGARAVNSLSNKINTNMFPKHRPFFRIDLTADQTENLKGMGLGDDDIMQITSAAERESIKTLSKQGYGSAALEAVKHLIIFGNALLYDPEGEKAQTFNLRDYVVVRSTNGEWTEIIARDVHTNGTLPEDMQLMATSMGHNDPTEEIAIYTKISKGNGRVRVTQELEDYGPTGRAGGDYPIEKSPWQLLTWNLARGQNYGTGLVEEYAGAFHQLSTYDMTIQHIAAIAQDIKILVNPMGQTNPQILNDAESGQYVYGLPDDIAYHSLEKVADLQVIMQQREEVKREIFSAFLVLEGAVRNAERVTREEIIRQAQELEESLGGVYSRLAEEWQGPKAARLMANLEGELAKVDIFVLTGLEALSRTTEHENLVMTMQDMTVLNEIPEEFRARMKVREVFTAFAAGRGVDISKFMMSEDEFDANQEKLAAQNAQQVGSEEQAKNEANQKV